MMDEIEILKYAVGVLSVIGTTIGGALIAVVVWNAKAVIKSLSELKQEVRNFDRRIIVLEAAQQPRVKFRVHDRRQQPGVGV